MVKELAGQWMIGSGCRVSSGGEVGREAVWLADTVHLGIKRSGVD